MSTDEERWGGAAPAMLRAVLAVSWVALVSRGLAAALPGARSGIERWIQRADWASSLFSQLSVLLGSSLLVLLVVSTLADRGLGAVYRILVVPAAASVLMLVMLASTMGLEPAANLALGASCLALASSGASSALRFPASRAPGLVLALLTLSAACRLALRLFAASGAARVMSPGLMAWLATFGSTFDVLAVSLAAARFIAEGRTRASAGFVAILASAGVLAWGTVRGSLDGATLWQVIAARGLSELSLGSVASPGGGRVAVDTIAVLLALAVAAWPGRISSKMVAVALGLLSRSGADVPASALVLTLGALVAPLGPGETAPDPLPLRERATSARPREAGG